MNRSFAQQLRDRRPPRFGMKPWYLWLALWTVLTPWRAFRRWRCHGSLMACGEVDPWAYAPYLRKYTAYCDDVVRRTLDQLKADGTIG